ncbi:hypothetical protein ELH53_33280 [Rhizobium ruizarguesonis]|nr:hypothetical protein ELH67_29320 [Rhizobium ruizarguesonis]TCB03021.1 hypothetical protein E0H65_04710 [Rhizobium leguminosarum bv. viciae]TBA09285.1 hypothetical protein ELH65_34340 [Rhizobium ruizarguesonis]TBA29953.1 hypothetical protein ELH60_35010 [Rhizobium ruizarguesonis]TBA75542.1 hypothetical protein ELH53_33280 [Rhizobium ruizarguesonis]
MMAADSITVRHVISKTPKNQWSAHARKQRPPPAKRLSDLGRRFVVCASLGRRLALFGIQFGFAGKFDASTARHFHRADRLCLPSRRRCAGFVLCISGSSRCRWAS